MKLGIFSFVTDEGMQSLHPPIHVGGNSRHAARRAARFAVGGRNEALLEAYAEAGVERVTFLLGTRPEAETLSRLDALVEVVGKYR
ncbi:hypothetical protein ACWEOE_30395 [Amycolatopsis sp. NPDC004368]